MRWKHIKTQQDFSVGRNAESLSQASPRNATKAGTMNITYQLFQLK